MRVVVRHGHFAFYPVSRGELVRFERYYNVKLYAEQDYFTFEALKDLPRYSLIAQPYGDLPALATFEGRHAWEVMKENGFVYSLITKTLVPVATMATQIVRLTQSNDYAVADTALVQPGALLQDSLDVLVGYRGEIDMTYKRLYVYARETLL